jgi:hypothetical protein
MVDTNVSATDRRFYRALRALAVSVQESENRH